jgi:hypothetical protein
MVDREKIQTIEYLGELVDAWRDLKAAKDKENEFNREEMDSWSDLEVEEYDHAVEVACEKQENFEKVIGEIEAVVDWWRKN